MNDPIWSVGGPMQGGERRRSYDAAAEQRFLAMLAELGAAELMREDAAALVSNGPERMLPSARPVRGEARIDGIPRAAAWAADDDAAPDTGIADIGALAAEAAEPLTIAEGAVPAERAAPAPSMAMARPVPLFAIGAHAPMLATPPKPMPAQSLSPQPMIAPWTQASPALSVDDAAPGRVAVDGAGAAAVVETIGDASEVLGATGALAALSAPIALPQRVDAGAPAASVPHVPAAQVMPAAPAMPVGPVVQKVAIPAQVMPAAPMPEAPMPEAIEAMASLSAVAQVALATYAAARPAQGGVPLAAEAGIDAPVAMVAGAAGQAASVEALAKKFGDFQPAPLARRGGDEAARLVLAQPMMSAPAEAGAVTTATMLEGQEGQEQGGSMPILAPLVPQSERASRPGAPPGAGTRLTAADAALTEMQALIDRIATWTQALRAQQGADGSWLARIAFPGEGSLAVRVSQTPDLVAVQLAGSEALATRVRGALESGGTRNGKALTVSVAALAAAEEGEDHG